MKTIYNAQGETKTCDAVDAREHVATGRWFADSPAIEIAGTVESVPGDAAQGEQIDGQGLPPVAEVPRRGRK